jgi:hypothetical protein
MALKEPLKVGKLSFLDAARSFSFAYKYGFRRKILGNLPDDAALRR